jgi:hypothetical protein
VPTGVPPQVVIDRTADPDVCSTPSEKIRTFTGTVLPAFATNVDPFVATGSPQIAVHVTGDTYVTVILKEARDVLPVSSRAVQVTVVDPTGNVLPLAGSQLTVGEASTASEAVTAGQLTALPSGSPVVTEMSSGRWPIDGAVVC